MIGLTSCNPPRELIRLDCQSFTRTMNDTIMAAGLWDYERITPEWLVEEIQPNDVDTWVNRYRPDGLPPRLVQTHADSESVLKERQWLHQSWNTLFAVSAPGDRFFQIKTPNDFRYLGVGTEGIVLIRDCEVIARVLFYSH